MKKMISVLSILVLSFLLSNVIAEAKTRTGGTSPSYTKPSTSTPKTSPSKPSSSSTTNTTTKPTTYSSLRTKYPKSTRYFSGDVLSTTLVFGTILLMLNDGNDVEPTYADEEGNVYTLADLEEMDVQIPEDEPVEDDLYSETVSFDENESDTEVPEEIETASSYENFENETYYEEENHSFNWLWLILPVTVVVIALSFLRRTKK
ncbi:hypothetical protein [Bacillus sp. ISL-46]|uniref:hypothetical protein n=1 Tax=Bacillus sp. ISL-46 TaxID=2819129 RepID=UPI001BE92692|nr:hypothetical protein [Bacillus sp. ISL-46]MBT2720880.1 hypothetical protein [Bacillus sp. ISL-46]